MLLECGFTGGGGRVRGVGLFADELLVHQHVLSLFEGGHVAGKVAITGFWLVAFVCLMSIFGSYELLAEASRLAAPYYIAALMGTGLLYRRWLFSADI